MGPDADTGEKVALGKSFEVARCDIFNTPFVNFARSDVPRDYEITQPLSRELVDLVYLDSKVLASGSDVLMTSSNGLGNTSYCKLGSDGLVQFTKTDTYSVQIHGYVNLPAVVADGFRTEVRIDGTNGIAFAPTLTPIVGGLCVWKWSGTIKKAAGQKLNIYFCQNTGQSVTTVAGGELSYIRIQPC